jgi:hypothetical protein
MKLPVYSRADLPRTAAVVVTPFQTAVSTGVVARELRVADVRCAGATLRISGVRSIDDSARTARSITGIRGRHLCGQQPELETPMAATDMAGIHANAQRDPAAAGSMTRIPKVE